jgi:hypothetical protein
VFLREGYTGYVTCLVVVQIDSFLPSQEGWSFWSLMGGGRDSPAITVGSTGSLHSGGQAC